MINYIQSFWLNKADTTRLFPEIVNTELYQSRVNFGFQAEMFKDGLPVEWIERVSVVFCRVTKEMLASYLAEGLEMSIYTTLPPGLTFKIEENDLDIPSGIFTWTNHRAVNTEMSLTIGKSYVEYAIVKGLIKSWSEAE